MPGISAASTAAVIGDFRGLRKAAPLDATPQRQQVADGWLNGAPQLPQRVSVAIWDAWFQIC
jgi:hypothetical protein